MTISVPLNLNNSIVSVAESARGLVHTDENGLSILSGFNYGSSLDYTPFGFTETFPRIDGLEHGAPTQTATTAMFKSVHLVAGTAVTVKGLFVAGDSAGHNDFGFMLIGQTSADVTAYKLADRSSVLANNGDWGFSFTVNINVTGNYNIVFGAADAVNHNDPSELLVQSITLDIPIASTSSTLDSLILADGSQLLANGSLLLPNGVLQPNYLAGGGDGLVASLIGQDGAGIISHDSGGIISHDSGGIISHDSGGIISHDSGGLSSTDGASLITNDGAGVDGAGASFAPPAGFVPTLGAYKAVDSTPADSPDPSPAPTNSPGKSATGTSTTFVQLSPPAPVNPASITLNKEPADLTAGAGPRALLTVDVNHDGRPDIVTADSSGNTVTVMLGNGDGTFSALAPISVAGGPAKLEAADLNGDHQLDLVAIGYDGDSATVLLGNGDGTFTPQAPMAVGHNPYDGTIVDLDGDGKLDLVVANSGAVSISVLKGNGDGTFQPQTQISRPTSPGYVAAADLDGDGTIDLVTTNYNDGTVTVLLQQPGGSFAAQASLTVRGNPVPVVLADLNRDGKLDMVVGNYADGSVSVLLGNGDGTFNAQTRISVGNGPTSVAVGDLNGDGTQDIVTANSNDNTVTVLLGRGDGTFVTQSAVAVGATPYYVSIADENNDGKPDVVVANRGGSTVSVLLNDSVLGTQSTFKDAFGNTVIDNADGLGRLTKETVTDPGGTLQSTMTLLYAADGTYQTHLEANTTAGMVVSDVAYGLHGEIDTTVFINGQVNSTNRVIFNNDGSYTRETTLAGVDGHDDLVYAANGTFVSHTHTDGFGNVTPVSGPGTLDTTPPTLTIASVSGAPNATSHLISGTIDVADAGSAVTVRDGLDVIGVAIPDNAGHWSLPFGVAAGAVHDYHLIASARDVAGNAGVSDTTIFSVNVDNHAPAVSGTVTLAAIEHDSGIRLIKQAELLGNVTDADTDIGSLTAGHLAIASGAGTLVDNHNGTWSYTPAAGDGSSVSFSYQVADATSTVADSAALDITAITPPQNHPHPLADFNGDGHSDFLWQNADGTAATWSIDGLNLSAGANIGFNPGPAWHVMGSGDFNGDGKADILWQNSDGTAAVWLMDGTNVLSGANVGFNPGAAWHEIAAADFNGDGKADILWQNSDGQAAVWLMDGLNVVSGANVGFNPGAAWHAISAGDFDGDGKADILWQNNNGQAAVWLMNGLNLVAGNNIGFNPGSDWHVEAAADFNADGKADILWQNANGQAAVWEMNGFNLVAGNNVGFNPGAAWQVHGAGDYNGDGKADILWQNTDGTPSVWLMDGFNLVAGSSVGFDPGASWHAVPQHHDLMA